MKRNFGMIIDSKKGRAFVWLPVKEKWVEASNVDDDPQKYLLHVRIAASVRRNSESFIGYLKEEGIF